MVTTVIDWRKALILEAVIREYEKTAEPVGSKAIASKYDIDASSATIRLEMAEMEAMGILEHPHISAGRTPTDKGWRYFIDVLMEEEDLNEKESKNLSEEINRIKEDADAIVKSISRILASFSRNLSIGTILDPKDFYSFGVSKLLREPEFSKADLMLPVVDLIDNFEESIEEVYYKINNNDIVVKIGKENPFGIDGISTIFSRFSLKDGQDGFFCLIGPKRMNYPKNISLVERIKHLLDKN